ncbi:hypothetical protein [Ramlibacter sp. AN1133]|uniref:hypothetical protein n=1 Tax=Ramlibacter sp. AN1133 TaxID=3133429 RepID=UPI0030C27D0F
MAEGWRCFHCDSSFTERELAALNFGPSEHCVPSCQVSAEQLRALEATLRRYQEGDTELLREAERMRSDHRLALRRQEEQGYARGLADGHRFPDDAAIAAGQGDEAPLAVATLEIPIEGVMHYSLTKDAPKLPPGNYRLYPCRPPDTGTAPTQHGPTRAELDLAMLVRKLAFRLKPEDPLRKGATEVLSTHGLQGSPLRTPAPAVTPQLPQLPHPLAAVASELRAVREALQFANDSPGGPITDTIWLLHEPCTAFDAFDLALERLEAALAPVATTEKDSAHA